MSTTNPPLTPAWSKLVDATEEFLLTLPFSTAFSIEVATSDTDVAPTVSGHVLRGDQYESINRTLIGTGYVYARSNSGPATAVLNAWIA